MLLKKPLTRKELKEKEKWDFHAKRSLMLIELQKTRDDSWYKNRIKEVKENII